VTTNVHRRLKQPGSLVFSGLERHIAHEACDAARLIHLSGIALLNAGRLELSRAAGSGELRGHLIRAVDWRRQRLSIEAGLEASLARFQTRRA
jgi:hypothetical protein